MGFLSIVKPHPKVQENLRKREAGMRTANAHRTERSTAASGMRPVTRTGSCPLGIFQFLKIHFLPKVCTKRQGFAAEYIFF